MHLRTLIKVSIRCILLTKKKRKEHTTSEWYKWKKGTFTPIVMSTSGGVGNDADRHHKRIASLIAEKIRESYADVLDYIRTRLRFCLLKSVLIAIRGFRGKRFKENTSPISSLSFNLIDFDKIWYLVVVFCYRNCDYSFRCQCFILFYRVYRYVYIMHIFSI